MCCHNHCDTAIISIIIYNLSLYTLPSYHGVLMMPSSAIIQCYHGGISCGNLLWEGLCGAPVKPDCEQSSNLLTYEKKSMKNSQEFSDNLHVFLVAKSADFSQLRWGCLLPSLFGSFQEPRSRGILSRKVTQGHLSSPVFLEKSSIFPQGGLVYPLFLHFVIILCIIKS